MLIAELLLGVGIVTLFEPSIKQGCGLPIFEQVGFLCRCDCDSVTTTLKDVQRALACRRRSGGVVPLGPCTRHTAIVGEPALRSAPNMTSLRPKHVQLVRTNYVKHALSRLQLWKNHARTKGTAASHPRLVNATALLASIRQTRAALRHARSVSQTYDYVVEYEALQRRPTVVVRDMLYAVGIRLGHQGERPSPSALHKTGSEALNASVSNFDQIASLLNATDKCQHEMWTSTIPETFTCH